MVKEDVMAHIAINLTDLTKLAEDRMLKFEGITDEETLYRYAKIIVDSYIFLKGRQLTECKKNVEMFKNLAGEISKGDFFVAVGKAHLVGTEGLINQFKSNGFNVTRVD